MNELPLLLDEPVRRRPFASDATSVGVADVGLHRRLPVWMAPASLIGRVRPSLRAATLADAAALERYPRFIVETVPVLVVVLLAVGFAVIHGSHLFRLLTFDFGWTRLSMAHVYLEIPIFMLLVILIGTTAPSLGVLFVLLYGVLDLVVAATQYQELTPLPGALAGRLVTLWLLWLLAVEIPVIGRSLALSWPAVARNRLVVAALAAVTTGAFTWLWTQAAPILVRPMFVWSNLAHVTIDPIRWVQNSGVVFAVVAGVAAGAVAYLRGPDGIINAEPVGESSGRPGLVLRIVRGLVVAALITITLGGLIASPYEAAALFLAVAASGPLARFVADRTPLGSIVRVTPPLFRFAIATGLAIGVSIAVITPLYQANQRATPDTTLAQPEFYSVLFALAITFFVVALATTPGSGIERRSSATTAAATTLLVLTGTLVLTFATTVTALADNCSGLGDCWGTPFLAGLAAGAIPPMLAAAAKGPPPDDKKYRDDRIREANRQKDWWSKNGRTPQEKADRMKYQDQRIKYYSQPTPPPSSDGLPVSDHAIASSGAATRG